MIFVIFSGMIFSSFSRGNIFHLRNARFYLNSIEFNQTLTLNFLTILHNFGIVCQEIHFLFFVEFCHLVVSRWDIYWLCCRLTELHVSQAKGIIFPISISYMGVYETPSSSSFFENELRRGDYYMYDNTCLVERRNLRMKSVPVI